MASGCVSCCSSGEASQLSAAEPQAQDAKQGAGSEGAEAGESGTGQLDEGLAAYTKDLGGSTRREVLRRRGI